MVDYGFEIGDPRVKPEVHDFSVGETGSPAEVTNDGERLGEACYLWLNHVVGEAGGGLCGPDKVRPLSEGGVRNANAIARLRVTDGDFRLGSGAGFQCLNYGAEVPLFIDLPAKAIATPSEGADELARVIADRGSRHANSALKRAFRGEAGRPERLLDLLLFDNTFTISEQQGQEIEDKRLQSQLLTVSAQLTRLLIEFVLAEGVNHRSLSRRREFGKEMIRRKSGSGKDVADWGC
jgi:hypothetical protein